MLVKLIAFFMVLDRHATGYIMHIVSILLNKLDFACENTKCIYVMTPSCVTTSISSPAITKSEYIASFDSREFETRICIPVKI